LHNVCVDLIKQLRQELSISKIIGGDGSRHDLAIGFIHTHMQLAPRTPLGPTMASDLPLAFAIHFDAGGIHHHVQRFPLSAPRQTHSELPSPPT
jgi:hypothetical protein